MDESQDQIPALEGVESPPRRSLEYTDFKRLEPWNLLDRCQR